MTNQQTDLEPRRPDASRSVREWLAERIPDGVAPEPHIDAIARSGDVPPPVASFLSSWKTWSVRHQAWRKRQPIDREGGRLRFFGGEWLEASCVPDGVIGFSRDGGVPLAIADAPVTLMLDLYAAGDVDGARRVAGALYDWVRIRTDADFALVRACGELRKASAER